ncbi:unnamed protein product [Oppiella nova]|uniref:non-specific serine/threonine protein kinase n=1 Tax=Oppiella nova TaxID=334625 RepID=A0A7R9LK81_9ACAR|nr:unnamed protein product [Oppiella nova]CAG2164057.1 unnamed protein product [Oppiella nova]
MIELTELYDLWLESKIIYIRMEYSEHNLRDCIHQKQQEYGRQSGHVMDVSDDILDKRSVWQRKYDDCFYAVKKIDFQDDTNLAECEKEVEKLIKVSSKYCVRYFEQLHESNVFYIRMELCSDSLRNILRHKRRVFGRQPDEPMNSIEFYISCHIFKEILECIQYLHELNPPVIHKDIHTGNILLARDVKNGRYFKVADFGMATIRKTKSNVSNLTREAPEVRRDESNDPKSDVYSLAIIAEEIFDFDLDDLIRNSSQKYSSDNEVLNKCGVHLKQVVKEMLNYDNPTVRPSCRQVLDKYNEWCIDRNCLENEPIFGPTIRLINRNDNKPQESLAEKFADHLGAISAVSVATSLSPLLLKFAFAPLFLLIKRISKPFIMIGLTGYLMVASVPLILAKSGMTSPVFESRSQSDGLLSTIGGIMSANLSTIASEAMTLT